MTPTRPSVEPDSMSPERSFEVAFRLANCLQYLLIGLLLEWLLFSETSVDGRLRALAVAVILLGMALGQAWFVLFALQLSLFFTERNQGLLNFDANSYGFVVLALLVIAYALSARQLVPAISRWATRQLQQALAASPNTTSQKKDAQAANALHLGYLLLTGMTLTIGVLAVATWLLNFLPITPAASRRWLQNSLAGNGVLWPGPTVLSMLLMLWIVVRELGWRHMTNSQARLWLRSEFVNNHYRDLVMIVRRLHRKASSRQR